MVVAGGDLNRLQPIRQARHRRRAAHEPGLRPHSQLAELVAPQAHTDLSPATASQLVPPEDIVLTRAPPANPAILETARTRCRLGGVGARRCRPGHINPPRSGHHHSRSGIRMDLDVRVVRGGPGRQNRTRAVGRGAVAQLPVPVRPPHIQPDSDRKEPAENALRGTRKENDEGWFRGDDQR
jgi:hypothetical protein